MNSKDQHRNMTTNDRLDALVVSASEFADVTAEKFEVVDATHEAFVNWTSAELTALRTDAAQKIEHAVLAATELVTAERDGRVRVDRDLQRVHDAFVNRGFWSRLNWLLTGR